MRRVREGNRPSEFRANRALMQATRKLMLTLRQSMKMRPWTRPSRCRPDSFRLPSPGHPSRNLL